MSDILIKNMKMPKNCFICPFKNLEICDGDCPLNEVPTPHGDLIDRDKASKRFAELAENIEAKYGFKCSASYTLASLFLQNKREFPTIIEAEPPKEGE